MPLVRISRDCLRILTGEMNLLNYILILGKAYLWTCRCKETKPSLRHFEIILLNKYQTEKYISFKSNNINLFKEKWRIFEKMFLLQRLSVTRALQRFFAISKTKFGGRQSNVSMTIFVFISSCQFHGHVRSSLDQE